MHLNADDSNVGGVCSVLRLYGFGEGFVGGYSREATAVTADSIYKTLDEFKKSIKDAAKRLDKLYAIDKASMVIAFATDLQPKAQGYLRDLGFTEFRVPVYKKYNHGISQFTISIEDFHKIIGVPYNVEEIDDRAAVHIHANQFEAIVAAFTDDNGEVIPGNEEALNHELETSRTNQLIRFGRTL